MVVQDTAAAAGAYNESCLDDVEADGSGLRRRLRIALHRRYRHSADDGRGEFERTNQIKHRSLHLALGFGRLRPQQMGFRCRLPQVYCSKSTLIWISEAE